MTPLTFVLAENHYRQQKKVTRITILALAFFLLPYLVLTPRYFESTSLTCSGIWFGLCLVAYMIAPYWDDPKIKKQLALSRVVLDDLMLEHHSKKLRQKIPLAEITHLFIWENANAEVKMIRVKTQTDYTTLRGFDSMNQIAAEMVARVSTSAIVQRKPLWLDTNSPLYMLSGLAVLSLFFAASLQGTADSFYGWIVVFYLLLGIHSLLWRPQFKREGKSKQSADTNTAIVAFIAAFFFFFIHVEEIRAYWQDPCAIVGRVARRSGCVEIVPAEGPIQFAADSRTVLWSERQFVLMHPYEAWLGFWTSHLSYDWVKLFTVSADQQTVAVIGHDGSDELVLDVWDIPTRIRQAAHAWPCACWAWTPCGWRRSRPS